MATVPPRHTQEFALRISPEMSAAITQAAKALRLSKSDFIRKSCQRNLVYVNQNEIPLLANPKVKAALAASLEEQNGGAR